jgi:hypothetical protein
MPFNKTPVTIARTPFIIGSLLALSLVALSYSCFGTAGAFFAAIIISFWTAGMTKGFHRGANDGSELIQHLDAIQAEWHVHDLAGDALGFQNKIDAGRKHLQALEMRNKDAKKERLEKKLEMIGFCGFPIIFVGLCLYVVFGVGGVIVTCAVVLLYALATAHAYNCGQSEGVKQAQATSGSFRA